MTERSIFFAALEIEDPAARRVYLDEACRADPALRERVDALLAADEEARTFMNRSPASTPFDLASAELAGSAAPGESPGPVDRATGATLADRYLVGEEIGRGGMGTVYRAEQLRPVRREVAVKLVNPGMDSRSVLARFEAERQALAVMDHPHIAKVLDAGATAEGRPFFVMELVRGVPLTDYCDARHLPMAGRLGLFQQICGAVQHAHQKGVIHRDLKPSNILVEEHEGVPNPKVIDFGLAKAVGDAAWAEQTQFTVAGSVAGTPLYMAPEQAGPDARDVDTRADVYALGAILYELLTGSPPIGRETLRRAALHEVFRVIREDDPPPPSSRLGSSLDLPSVAANRATEPTRLGRFVRGDLDWVTLKALEKDRVRRYESAAALGADVERFLHHEPVAAGPPTLRYRAGKFVRRNRAAVVAASLVVLALVLGIIGTTLGLIEAGHQRDVADAARLAEKTERSKAESNLAYATKGLQLLGSVFVGLNPEKIAESGRPLQDVLKENLKTAVRDLDESTFGDPLAVAEMQDKLGNSLQSLGDYQSAVALFEKAAATRVAQLGPTAPASLISRSNLASGYFLLGRSADATSLLEGLLELMKVHLGPEHPQTMNSMTSLAYAYQSTGRQGDAVALWERTLDLFRAKLGVDHPDTLKCLSSLSQGYHNLGRLADALKLAEQSLQLTKARLGSEHPDTIRCLGNLAVEYLSLGRLDEAIPLFEESLRLSSAKLGPDHPATLIQMTNLAYCYSSRKEPERAAALNEDALRLMRIKLGADHPHTLNCLANLSRDLVLLKRFDRAIPVAEELLALRKTKLGPGHSSSLDAANLVADAYCEAGRHDEAILLYEQLIRDREKYQGRDSIVAQSAIGGLGLNYLKAGRPIDALPFLEAGFRTNRSHPEIRRFGPRLVDAYTQVGKKAEAVRLALDCVDEARGRLPADGPQLASQLSTFSLKLLRLGKYADAEPLLREALAIQEKAEPDAWTTFSTLSQRGGALLGGGKLAEAEPLLLRGYEGMKQRAARIPPAARDRLLEAIDRLIELYEKSARPADAKKWRDERPKDAAPTPLPTP